MDKQDREAMIVWGVYHHLTVGGDELVGYAVGRKPTESDSYKGSVKVLEEGLIKGVSVRLLSGDFPVKSFRFIDKALSVEEMMELQGKINLTGKV